VGGDENLVERGGAVNVHFVVWAGAGDGALGGDEGAREEGYG
jgi:hypothetical protein